MNQPQTNLYVILRFKEITKYYGKSIKIKLISDAANAELLLEKYEVKLDGSANDLFLPDELTNEDKENIIRAYIDSDKPNLNYLRLIKDIHSTNELFVSDKTRLKAKRRAEQEEAELFKENPGLLTEITVCFSKSQCDPRYETNKNNHLLYSYGSRWLEENSDYNTLLNNFIYLFDYTDLTMRVTLVHKINEMGALERFLFTRSRNAYFTSTVFNGKFSLAIMQMSAYYYELLKLNIRVEEIIEWFFKSYLKDEFEIDGFVIQMPSEKSTYFEKCRTILPEMESILKQYDMLVSDRVIDSELLHICSKPLAFKDIQRRLF